MLMGLTKCCCGVKNPLLVMARTINNTRLFCLVKTSVHPSSFVSFINRFLPKDYFDQSQPMIEYGICLMNANKDGRQVSVCTCGQFKSFDIRFLSNYSK